MDQWEAMGREAAHGREASRRHGTRRRRLGRWTAGAALTAVALLALPATTWAASVSSSGGALTYTAGSNETNVVSIAPAPSGSDFVVTEAGAGVTLVVGEGCTADAAQPNVAVCAATGVVSITVDLKELGDQATIDPAVTVNAQLFGRQGDDTLSGGGGSDLLHGGFDNDVLNSRDGTADEVACGAGTDTANADREALDAVNLDCETVDRGGAPATIDAGPEGTIATETATFEFSSTDPEARFECRIDESEFVPCASPTQVSGLTDGEHIFEVRALDRLDNPGVAAARAFAVALPKPPPPPSASPAGPTISSAAGSFPVAVPAQRAASFVLIAGRTLKVSRKRYVRISLNCAGNRDCRGNVRLKTTKRVRYAKKRRGILTLAFRRFSIEAPKSARVRLRLTKSKYRLVKRLRRVRITIRIVDRDSAGRLRISERDVFLRA
jgi:hypothetical protein